MLGGIAEPRIGTTLEGERDRYRGPGDEIVTAGQRCADLDRIMEDVDIAQIGIVLELAGRDPERS